MKRKPLTGWLLLSPALLWILAVTIFPTLFALRLSFMKTAYGFGPMEWVGLSNYLNLFKEIDFWKTGLNSLLWLFGNLILQLSLPMFVALYLNRRFFGRNFVRSIILTPWIIPAIVASIIWRWMLEPGLGIVNDILNVLFKTAPILFLGSTQLSLLSIVLINTWRFIPLGTVLLLAALQTIPKEHYEAAKVDGATAFQEFIYITFPLVGKVVWFVGLLASIWVFNIVDIIWLLTEGGPGMSSQTVPVLLYRTAFKIFRMGEASAMAMLSSVFLILLALLFFKVVKPKDIE